MFLFFLLLLVNFLNLSIQMSFPPARPPPKERKFVSTAVDNEIQRVKSLLKDKDLAQLFENCFPNTLDTTIDTDANGDTFVITGDIDAMWLRDSTNQLKPYIAYALKDAKLQAMLSSAIRSQATKVLIDPYANAHYPDNNHVSPWLTDTTTKLSFGNTHTPAMTTSLHERKFEIDSLLSFFELSTLYANATGDLSFATPTWQAAALRAVVVLRENQRLDTNKCAGAAKAPYTFARSSGQPSDTLQDGVGAPFRGCGLIHSSFRPSDDALILPFNIAQNAFAVVNLRALANLADKISFTELKLSANSLANEVDIAIRTVGIVTHTVTQEKVFAFEVDGFGSVLLMDDANNPSLLSLPLMGYVQNNDPVYLATRRALLNTQTNPWFVSVGNNNLGAMGSPHTGYGRVWPMSLLTRALTTDDETEISALLVAVKNSTSGTGLMNESWSVSVGWFTRSWFAWCNSFFGEAILTLLQTHPHVLT